MIADGLADVRRRCRYAAPPRPASSRTRGRPVLRRCGHRIQRELSAPAPSEPARTDCRRPDHPDAGVCIDGGAGDRHSPSPHSTPTCSTPTGSGFSAGLPLAPAQGHCRIPRRCPPDRPRDLAVRLHPATARRGQRVADDRISPPGMSSPTPPASNSSPSLPSFSSALAPVGAHWMSPAGWDSDISCALDTRDHPGAPRLHPTKAPQAPSGVHGNGSGAAYP